MVPLSLSRCTSVWVSACTCVRNTRIQSCGTEWLFGKFQLSENCDWDDDVSWGKLIL